ncbi:MAG: hypothetical protein GEV04_21705 [Actinophytocola sp.]|nr:hypothetical protein [Actinophytocola sp.]
MTSASSGPSPRRRGNIRRMGRALQVRVTAGNEPATGERIVLSDVVRIDKPGNERSERAARVEAEKLLTRMQARADELKAASTKATFGALLDRWLPQHEVDQTTWGTYESIVRLYLKPALGDVPLALLTTSFADRMERYYAQLRRCSVRCTGRPFVEHRATGPHDCADVECHEHRCSPLAPSYIHRIHAVVSAALSAGARWGWITHNPADTVKLPARKPPQPRPPSPPRWRRSSKPPGTTMPNGACTSG